MKEMYLAKGLHAVNDQGTLVNMLLEKSLPGTDERQLADAMQQKIARGEELTKFELNDVRLRLNMIAGRP